MIGVRRRFTHTGRSMTQLSALVEASRRETSGTNVNAPMAQPAVPFFSRDAVRFVGVLFQLGLLVMLIRQFDLERGPLSDLMLLAFVGFAIHHFLPMPVRLPFFAVLSMASIPIAIGLTLGVPILLVGFLLIGVCHLRRPFWQRVLAAAAIMIFLLVLRTTLYGPPIVVIGAMFMFRLIVYLHDMKNQAAPFSFVRATSYFFMLPNVCFPLFPLVDYKTFCSTYYNDTRTRIYQTGVRWMFRGVVHLLLYRVIYQFVQEDPLTISDLGGVARFMVTTYLLYLRVSGQFHLIIGVLHLFGFNLPETHHLYLLASSFTDLWRRINIYWRDFILKVFFYPACFRLKRWGPIKAMAAATVFAFFATWILHAYQTFWVRGVWSFRWQDAFFWWALATLVLITAIFEAKRPRQRSLQKPVRTFRGELGIALRTIGTFLVMCILWTVWSSESADELVRLAVAAGNVTLIGVASIVLVFAVLGAAAVLFGRSSAERTEASRGTQRGVDRFAFWPSASFVAVGTLALLLFGESHRLKAANDTLYAEVVQSLRTDRLNELEYNKRTRGYYEDLDVTREDANVRMGLQALGWWPAKIIHITSKDFLLYRPIPDRFVPVHGITVTYNSRGLRGPWYEEKKAPGVFRIAVVGSSTEAGRGVSDDQTFVHQLEKRLNREDVNGRISKFELWNFSVEGYGALQKLMVVEQQVLAYDPDLILWITYGPERQRLGDQLADAIRAGYNAPPPFEESVQEICKKAHIDASMPAPRIERLLRPYTGELIDQVFQRFAELCRTHHTRGCFVYRPQLKEFVHLKMANRQEVLRFAHKTEQPILDLTGCFSSEPDPDKLMVSPESTYYWRTLKREGPDDHPNAAGHKLLADRLYELLHTPEGSVLLKPGDEK
jgi:hypothetical protein